LRTVAEDEFVYSLEMGNRENPEDRKKAVKRRPDDELLPAPSASYRRRAWVQFQRALDPLAPIKQPPPPRP
jgi:hypothetical protein